MKKAIKSKTIKTAFLPGDRVLIKDSGDIKGRIVSLTAYVDGSVTYLVTWWADGERKSSECWSSELQAVED